MASLPARQPRAHCRIRCTGLKALNSRFLLERSVAAPLRTRHMVCFTA